MITYSASRNSSIDTYVSLVSRFADRIALIDAGIDPRPDLIKTACPACDLAALRAQYERRIVEYELRIANLGERK